MRNFLNLSLGLLLMAMVFPFADARGADKEDEVFYVFNADPGADDFGALFLMTKMFKQPDLCLATYGNKPLAMTARNMFILKKYLGISSRVAIGAKNPISGELPSCGDFHGKDGLGNCADALQKKLNMAPIPDPVPESKRALADFLLTKKNIIYISTGPLTDLAELITVEPRLEKNIRKAYVMGGGFKIFNSPHDTEYNFYGDPQAVNVVLKSNLDITLFPTDLNHQYPITREVIDQMAQTGRYPDFIVCFNYFYDQCVRHDVQPAKSPGAILHDAFPIVYLISPECFVVQDKKVAVDQWGHLSESAEGKTIHIATKMVPDTMNKLLVEAMKK